MEDQVVRRLCHEMAEQVLVPPRTYTPVGPAVPAVPEARASGHAQVCPESPREAVPHRLAILRRAAAEVASRAIALHRLCRSAQYAVPIAVRSGGGGGGGSAGAGGGDGALEAALCVCATLAAAQPHVWRALLWRARAVRPRTPVLRLGRPIALSTPLRDAEQFIARSARLVPLTVGPTMTTAATTSAAANDVSSSGQRRSGAGEAELDEVLAERIAACYFLTVTSAQERRRCPQVLAIAVDVAERRAAARKRVRHDPGDERVRGVPRRAMGSDALPDRRLAAREDVAATRATEPPLSPPHNAGALLADPHPHDNDDDADPHPRPHHRSSGSGRARWPPPLTLLAPLASDGGRATGFAGDSRLAGDDDVLAEDDGYAAEDVTGEGGGRPLPLRSRQGRGEGGADVGAADPAALWASLYAVAVGDATDEDSSGDEAGPTGSAAAHPRRAASRGVGHPSSLLARGAESVGLVELAAEAERCRGVLHRYRLTACLSLPLLYRLEPSPTGRGTPAPLPSSFAPHTAGAPAHALPLSHPGHYLFPARAECLTPSPSTAAGLGLGPGLLAAPPSTVTARFLWTRLLVCASWVLAYANDVLPALTEEAVEEPKADARRPTAQTAASATGRRRRAWQLLTSAPGAATLAYCVAVVKEARQYDCITCPVCDSLSPAVTHQRERLLLRQQRQRPRGGQGAPSHSAGGSAETGLRWATLAEDRRALGAGMRPYLALAAEAEAEAEAACDGSATTDEDSGSASEEVDEVATGCLDVDGPLSHQVQDRHLRRCWSRFALSQSPQEAARCFAPRRGSEREGRLEGSGEGAGPQASGTVECHDAFVQALAARLHTLVELLVAAPAVGARSGHAQGRPQQQQQQQLRAADVALRRLLPSPSSAPASCAVSSASPLDLREQTLETLTSAVLLGGRPAALWGPLLLFTPPNSTEDSATLVDAHVPTSATVGVGAGASVRSPAEAGAPLEAHWRRQCHRLRAQRGQLHELLRFVPRVPVVTEGDAVLECARCYSFLHQACVGPVQRDFMGSCFLCHTCRLRSGGQVGLEVRPFA